MPRARSAPRKRSRTWKDDWIVCQQPTLPALVRQMDEPLAEAIGFVEALRLMGDGLSERGCEEGSAILRVAEAVQERLRSVQDVWFGLIQDVPSRVGPGRS
jgi:hypothetical protein